LIDTELRVFAEHAGFRHGVFSAPLSVGPDGAVEKAGILIFHTANAGGSDRITLSVRDPCGRVGFAERTLSN
jgi:hypothetical protein